MNKNICNFKLILMLKIPLFKLNSIDLNNLFLTNNSQDWPQIRQIDDTLADHSIEGFFHISACLC